MKKKSAVRAHFRPHSLFYKWCKVLSHKTCEALSLSATLGETHSVVKFFTAISSSWLASIKSRVAI